MSGRGHGGSGSRGVSPEGQAVALAAGGATDPARIRQTVATLLADRADVAVETVLDALLAELARRGQTPDRSVVATTGERLAALGARVVLAGRRGYPRRLADAWPELGAPPWLFVRAPEPGLPRGPAVAVVGTRHPTLDGLRTTRQLGRLLATHGVTVVSGLARGIDQAAHRGALDAGGPTVGVLGTGFAVDYPWGDGAVREAVAAAGGLVTELAPAAGPRPRHFLWRNRIVSGLADVVVVVEGRSRSGSLQTARLAAGQGRDVWAVPGSLHAPTSAGPLALIRDGAQVVTQITDVLDAVAAVQHEPDGDGDTGAPVAAAGLDPDTRRVRELLGPVPATPSALATAAGLPLPAVAAALADLADRGLATTTPRGAIATPDQTNASRLMPAVAGSHPSRRG
ncbi:MAG: DNA-protecting protein DprA [Euzebyales bacterium]|nr:DNA-protecting protein DprA [Euzebyales bacterium]